MTNYYKITVRETNYVAYYVQGTSAENAQSNWANNYYDSDIQAIEDSDNDILSCEEASESEVEQVQKSSYAHREVVK